MAGIFDALSPTTIANFARGAWDGLSQNNPVFSELKRLGNIEYDVSGTRLEGVVEAGRYQPTISAPGMDVAALYQSKVRHARWVLEWAELFNGFSIDRGMLRRNDGPQALVKLRDTEFPAACRDAIYGTNGLSQQLLAGSAQAYTAAGGTGLPFFGLPTFLPGAATGLTTAQAITAWDLEGFNPATGAVTGVVPADSDAEVAVGGAPTAGYGTYGGLSIRHNGLSGIDGLEADAWRPTLVNTRSNAFGIADADLDNVLRWSQYAVDRANRFSANDASKKPSAGYMSLEYFQALGQKIADKQTIMLTAGTSGPNSNPVLGYAQFRLQHAGLQWMWDENMPAKTAYVVNFKQLQFKVQKLYADLVSGNPLKVSGEDAGIMEAEIVNDPLTRGYLCGVTIPGQFVANPRYFVRCSNYSE